MAEFKALLAVDLWGLLASMIRVIEVVVGILMALFR